MLNLRHKEGSTQGDEKLAGSNEAQGADTKCQDSCTQCPDMSTMAKNSLVKTLPGHNAT